MKWESVLHPSVESLKPEGRRQLGRPESRWEENIKLDLQEVGSGGAWAGLIWLRIGTVGGLL
jgi:hypothetical protein